jgi:hypothetical protein
VKVHVSYAHLFFAQSQRRCCETALEHGFDKSIPLGLKDIDDAFFSANERTLSQLRGAGFWLWKPYVILMTLQSMGDSDWLMYTDAGMYFARDPWSYILAADERVGEQGVVAMGRCAANKEYTKRDAFVLMGMDEPRYTDAEQITASVVVCRNTTFARSFLEEWLAYATDPRILTDLPNTQGLPNYPEFKDHRHDQSIMSLLCIRHGVPVLGDITEIGMPDDPYLVHTRDRA